VIVAVFAAVLLISAALVSYAVYGAYQDKLEREAKPQVVTSSASPVWAPPSDPATVARYRAKRAAAIEEYPEYYRCSEQSATGDRADAPANLNVNVHLRYDPKENRYLVVSEPDPRVIIDSSVVDLPDDPNPDMRRVQTLEINFAEGVRYFRTYERFAVDFPSLQYLWVGSGEPLFNDVRDAPYLLVIYPNKHRYLPEHLVTATDTSTCSAGPAALPDSFHWPTIMASGQALPEYAVYRMGHPQG
jgi:hypothetical protein